MNGLRLFVGPMLDGEQVLTIDNPTVGRELIKKCNFFGYRRPDDD